MFLNIPLLYDETTLCYAEAIADIYTPAFTLHLISYNQQYRYAYAKRQPYLSKCLTITRS